MGNSVLEKGAQAPIIDSPGRQEFIYSSLPQDGSCIRLLRLLPGHDKDTAIQCEVFDYQLETRDSGHLYEALSYVWGNPDETELISLNDRPFPVTANLHAALLHLRDRSLERIIWVDAICINQCDQNEKSHQIQLIASVYGFANRVVVWLGEKSEDSNEALELIRSAAATDAGHQLSADARGQESIFALLQRQWFRRIWVLQEVALARCILLMCGRATISDHAFCHGLGRLDISGKVYPNSHRTASVIYLISGAIFRPRYDGGTAGKSSLPELIDMYHTHQATYNHDKVYALLGMSTQDPLKEGLHPDYMVSWASLFQQLVCFCLGNQVSVRTWDTKQTALVQGPGIVIGHVAAVKSSENRYDRQQLEVNFNNTSEALYYKSYWGNNWMLQASAKPINQGDIICLLRGALQPTIIRDYQNYFLIIMIAVKAQQALQNDGPIADARSLHNPMSHSFEDRFMLVWDWHEYDHASSADEAHDLALGISTTIPEKAEMLYDVASILSNAGRHEAARSRLEIMHSYGSSLGEESLLILRSMDLYAATYKREQKWEDATKNSLLALEARKRAQGPRHRDTMESMASLASIYVEQCGFTGWDLRMMNSMIDRVRTGALVKERDVMRVMTAGGKELLTWLMESNAVHLPLTANIVHSAKRNFNYGRESIMLFLNRLEQDYPVQNKAVEQIIQFFDDGVLECLLARHSWDIFVTEAVVEAAAENRGSGKNSLRLLLRRQEVRVASNAVAKIAKSFPEEVDTLLIHRTADDIKLMQDAVLSIAVSCSGKTMTMLLERWSNHFEVTHDTFLAASRNEAYGRDVLKVLLDHQGKYISITEDLIETAIRNQKSGHAVLELLLSCYHHGDIEIGEAMLEDVARNGGAGIAIFELFLGHSKVHLDLTPYILCLIAEQRMDMIHLLLHRRGDSIQITQDLLVIIARNENSGDDLIRALLGRTSIDETIDMCDVLRAAASNHEKGPDIMRILLEHFKDISLPADVVEAAFSNTESGSSILDLILDQRPTDIEITEYLLILAASNMGEGYEILSHLATRPGVDIGITADVIEAAARNPKDGPKIMKLLLKWVDDNTVFTQDAITQSFKWADEEMATRLLKRMETRMAVTDQVVDAVSENETNKNEILCLLFGLEEVDIEISEHALEQICDDFDDSTLRMAVNRPGTNIQITSEVVRMLPTNHQQLRMRITIRDLLNQLGNQATYTVDGMKDTIREGIFHFIKPLLDRLGNDIPITEEVLKAAANNREHGKVILDFLFSRTGNHLHFAQKLLGPASSCGGLSTITFLFETFGENIRVDDNALIEALSGDYRNEVLGHIVDQKQTGFAITEEVLKAAAQNGDRTTLSILFQNWQVTEITEDVIIEAQSNRNWEQVLTTIYHYRGMNVPITDRVIDAVWSARPIGGFEEQRAGSLILTLLLELWGGRIGITRTLIQTISLVARNQSQRKALVTKSFNCCSSEHPIQEETILEAAERLDEEDIKLFLARLEKPFPIGKDLVQHASHNLCHDRNAIIWLFLEQLKCGDTIGEEIIAEIARYFDEELVEHLFAQLGDNIPVTQVVLTAAARNAHNGRPIMELLLNKVKGKISPSEKIIEAVVRLEDGAGLLDLLSQQWGTGIPPSHKFLKAAVRGDPNTVSKLLFDKAWDSFQLTEDILMEAMRNYDRAILESIFSRFKGRIHVTEEILAYAATRYDSQVVRTLLEEVKGDLAITSALIDSTNDNQNRDSREILKVLLSRPPQCGTITREAAMKLAGTRDREVVRRVLEFDVGLEAAHAMILAAAKNQENGKEILKLLLSYLHCGISVSEETWEQTAYWKDAEFMRLLLTQSDGGIPTTKRVMKAAYENEDHSKGVMKLLLGQSGPISMETVILVARLFDKEMLRLAIDRCGSIPCMTPILDAAAANPKHGREVLRWLLGHLGPDAAVTEDTIKAAASNKDGEALLSLLFNRCGKNIRITKNVMEAAAANDNARGLLPFIVRAWEEVPITEGVLKAVLSSSNPQKVGTVTFLLSRWKQKLPITDDILELATKYSNDSGKTEDVLSELLEYRQTNIPVSERVVRAVVRSQGAESRLQLLISRWGVEKLITEDVVRAIPRQRYREGIIKVIVCRAGKCISAIGPALLEVAAELTAEISDVVVRKLGKDIRLSEDVLKAAARNTNFKADVLELLYNTWGDSIKITESVLVSAAGNEGGKTTLEFISKRWEDILITEEVMKAAAKNPAGKGVLNFIVQTWGKVGMSEEIVKAAAGSRAGKDNVDFLMKTWEKELPITEDVLKVVAANRSGKEILLVLLWRLGKDIPITEEVMKVAAKNPRGEEILGLIVERWGLPLITEGVIEAAEGNEDNQGVLTFLERCATWKRLSGVAT